MKKKIILSSIILISLSTSCAKKKADDVLKMNLTRIPMQLDPIWAYNFSGKHILANLHHGLFRIDQNGQLEKIGAKKSRWINPKLLRVELKTGQKFSNGEPILAHHYVKSFQRLVGHNSAPQAEQIFALKNAKSILNKEMPPEKLGVRAESDTILEFSFDEIDSEFEHRLALPALAPIYYEVWPKNENWQNLVFSGPFQVKGHKKNQHVRLSRLGSPPLEVEFFAVQNEATAVNLFKTQKLNLVRWIPFNTRDTWDNKKQIRSWPWYRFDYFGFGENLQKNKVARQALTTALNFKEYQELAGTPGRPGCPGLPENFYLKKTCQEMDLLAAKKNKKQIENFQKASSWSYFFSKVTGEDGQNLAEWTQNQWKKAFGISVALKPIELGMLRQSINSLKPNIFRKSLGLERATCLAALEVFHSKSPDNFIGLQSKAYDQIIKKLQESFDPDKKRELCQNGLEMLLNEYRIVPLGKMGMYMLDDGRFKDWYLSPLNLIDFSRARRAAN